MTPEQKSTIKNILIDYKAGYYDSPEHATDHILYVIGNWDDRMTIAKKTWSKQTASNS